MVVINRWVLRTSPGIVKLAELEDGFPVIRGRKPLGFEKIFFFVPPGIEIYDPFEYNAQRNEQDMNVVFVVRDRDDSDVYMSLITKRENNLIQNGLALFDYTWYEKRSTAAIYARVAEKRYKNLLVGNFPNHNSGTLRHPFKI